jgi:hypothetical protein
MKSHVHPVVCVLALLLVTAPVAAQRAQEGATGTPESVTLRFQIIHADGFTETDPAIEDVSGVLRSLFRFRGYRLAAESVVRVTAGAHFSQKTVDSDGAEYVIEGEGSISTFHGSRTPNTPCARPTAARTNSSRPWRTNCATLSRPFVTPCGF